MKRRMKIILAAVGLVTAAGTFACARHHAHSPERAKKMVHHGVERVMSKVDATDAQRAEVHKIKDRVFAEFEKAHQDSGATKRAFLAEWKSDKPDAEKMHKLADQRVAAYQKAMHELIDGMVEVHGTLEPEQRAKITKHVEKRLEKHGH